MPCGSSMWLLTCSSLSYLWAAMRKRPSSSCISLFSSRLLRIGKTLRSAFSMPSSTSTRPWVAACTAHCNKQGEYRRLSADCSNSLAQDCSNFVVLAMELLQSYTKPSIFSTNLNLEDQVWKLSPIMLSYQYRDSHYKSKTFMRLSLTLLWKSLHPERCFFYIETWFRNLVIKRIGVWNSNFWYLFWN